LERVRLYEKIDTRAESMVNRGLIGEYTSLIERGYSPEANAMQGLGYRHCGMYLQGLWTLEEMKGQLKQDTRRYAKRQLSWFRGMEGMTWLDNSDPRVTIAKILNSVAGIIGRQRELCK
jgi:tRNA dimethylallyltransferase